ncbi:MAG: hypothetical protein U0Q15_05440 [Kineosporiaceae bacterium]
MIRRTAWLNSRNATAAGVVLALVGGLGATLGSGAAQASTTAPRATSTSAPTATATSTPTRTGTPTGTPTIADCFPGCRVRAFDFEDGTAQGWTDSGGQPLSVTDAAAASGKLSAAPSFVLSSRGPSVTITSPALASPIGYWYTASVKVLGDSTRAKMVRLAVEGSDGDVREEPVMLSTTEWRTVRTWFRPKPGTGTITLRLTESNDHSCNGDIGQNIQTAYLDDGLVEVPVNQSAVPRVYSPTPCPTVSTMPPTTPPTPCLPGRCTVYQEPFAASTVPSAWTHTGTGELSLRREGGALTLNSLQATQVSTIGGPSVLVDDPRLKNPSGRWFQVKLKVRVDDKSKPRVRLQVDGTDLVQTTEVVTGPKFKVLQAWFKPSGPVRITVVAAPSTCVRPQHVIPVLMIDDVTVGMPGQGKAPKGEPTPPPATCW